MAEQAKGSCTVLLRGCVRLLPNNGMPLTQATDHAADDGANVGGGAGAVLLAAIAGGVAGR